MTKTKILRCSAPGCRALTSADLCEKHREKKQAASPWDAITPEQWEASRVKAQNQFNAMRAARDLRDAQRADLAALQDGAEKQARRAEQPIFFEESYHGI